MPDEELKGAERHTHVVEERDDFVICEVKVVFGDMFTRVNVHQSVMDHLDVHGKREAALHYISQQVHSFLWPVTLRKLKALLVLFLGFHVSNPASCCPMVRMDAAALIRWRRM